MIELRLCSSHLVNREAVVWKLLRFGCKPRRTITILFWEDDMGINE